MSLDPNKTYLVWNSTEFPNSTNAQFKAPAGSTIDWGDGTVETFDTASTSVNTHTYTDGKTEHTIAISGLTSISNNWFKGCINLTSVTIGNSVTSIGPSAFFGCSSLTSITIPDSVTSIGSSVFKNCSSLTSVTIPNSVTSIGSSALYNCSSLTSITIPNSVTNIGENAFRNCYKLIEVKNLSTLSITAGSESYGYVGYYAKRVYTEGESYLSTDDNGYIIYDDGTDKILMGYTGTETNLTLPNGITQINQYAFYNNRSLTSVTIPNSVTSIGYRVFSNCSSLTSVTIPNSVASIGDYAFSGCSSLTSVTIPNSVTSIGSSALYNCSSLTSVTIGNSVTSIGSYAFYNCSSLTQLILFPSTPPTLASNAIPANVQSIYVQQSSKAAYQAATNWTTFASKIVSDNIYLSFVRFNQKNKEYIREQVSKLSDKLYKHEVFGNINEIPAVVYVSIVNDISTDMTSSEISRSITNHTKCIVTGSAGASGFEGFGRLNKGTEENTYYLTATCVTTGNTFYGISNMQITASWGHNSVTEL